MVHIYIHKLLVWGSLTLAPITDIFQENNLYAQKVTSQVSAKHVVSMIDAVGWLSYLTGKGLYIKQSYTKYRHYSNRTVDPI